MGDFIKDCENMVGHVQFLFKKNADCTTKFSKCDSFHLDYMYFQEVDSKLVNIETSLKQCIVQEL